MFINLPNRLQLWREHNLITEDDARRIREFEESHHARSWVSAGIAVVGVTALVTGIISIIASNWDHISDSVKIASYFLLQGGVGLLFLKTEKTKGLLREISLAIFTLLFFAGIALYGQIYNLSGPPWQAMLLWTCITSLAVARANSRALCSLWCIIVIRTVADWGSSPVALHHEPAWGFVVATSVLLATLGMFTHSGRFASDTLRNASIVCGIGFLLLIATPLTNIAWSLGAKPSPSSSEIISAWCSFALATLVSLTRSDVSPHNRRATAILFIVTALYLTSCVPPFRNMIPDGLLAEIFGAAGFLAVWTAAAAAAATASIRRLFDIASLIISLRFIVIYFEVFGTLAMTGVGLILSGLVVLGIGVGWNRWRKRLSVKLGGAV